MKQAVGKGTAARVKGERYALNRVHADYHNFTTTVDETTAPSVSECP